MQCKTGQDDRSKVELDKDFFSSTGIWGWIGQGVRLEMATVVYLKENVA